MKSWSWTTRLSADVEDGDSVTVATPGYDADIADSSKAELAVNNVVTAVPDEAVVTFAEDEASAEVRNVSGDAWPAGVEIYLYVPSKAIDPDDIGEATSDIAALEARMTAVEGVNAALQTQVNDLEARVAALEGAA